jgi:hypothetical protein
MIDTGESCDGTSGLPPGCAAMTNPSTGMPFTGGTVSCTGTCQIDTSGCF